MPAIYAHFRLGEEVREELDGEEKRAVEAYPELFGIGTHGPDILFYYRPLFHNEVSGLGHRIHAEAGSVFFARAAEVLNSGGERPAGAAEDGKTEAVPCDPASLAYIYGVLCHFALDVSCHGYIGEYIESHGVSHAKIESELDRELMVRDGFDPVGHSIVGHLVPSEENARVIARFYGRRADAGEESASNPHDAASRSDRETGSGDTGGSGALSAVPRAENGNLPVITEKEIRKALRSMVFYSGVLLSPSHAKRAVLNFGMNLVGASGFRDMMIGYEKDPRCEESTADLITRYEEAKRLALRLIKAYRGQFLTKEDEPDKIYRYNFESEK